MRYALKILPSTLEAYGGFLWKTSGDVICPDWKPTHICGNGLHAFLNGEGDIRCVNDLEWIDDTWYWLILAIHDDVEVIDLDGKIKFPSCEVIYASQDRNYIINI